MKSKSAIEEFLELCEQAQPVIGHSVNAHGSLVVESDSLVESSSNYALCSTSTNEFLGKPSQAEIEDSVSLLRRDGEDVTHGSESYQSPIAHSTPSPCDENAGFWIDCDKISEDLRRDTVAITKKYFFR
ncbi:unnamed protein product [Cylicocyclus nassatus]|uniref:Uncharacterized protein n=1 Tax=Cylicocyclus nassatus TaxID=53992 RepID=A0AA36GJ69_CYLNA|nr:unnamed protein product [Cylicocyclus nassatus]